MLASKLKLFSVGLAATTGVVAVPTVVIPQDPPAAGLARPAPPDAATSSVSSGAASAPATGDLIPGDRVPTGVFGQAAAPPAAIRDPDPINRAILAKLERPFRAPKFSRNIRFFDYIAALQLDTPEPEHGLPSGIPVEFDHGMSGQDWTEINAGSLPRRASLRSLLTQAASMCSLEYVVRDGRLVFTPTDRADSATTAAEPAAASTAGPPPAIARPDAPGLPAGADLAHAAPTPAVASDEVAATAAREAAAEVAAITGEVAVAARAMEGEAASEAQAIAREAAEVAATDHAVAARDRAVAAGAAEVDATDRAIAATDRAVAAQDRAVAREAVDEAAIARDEARPARPNPDTRPSPRRGPGIGPADGVGTGMMGPARPAPRRARAVDGPTTEAGLEGVVVDGPVTLVESPAAAAPPPSPREVDDAKRNEAILARLDQPIPLKFPEKVSLNDLVTYLKRATTQPGDKPIPIFVDQRIFGEVQPNVVVAEVPFIAKDATVPLIFIDLEDVPLRTSLRLALRQVGLDYVVADGILMIGRAAGLGQLAAPPGLGPGAMGGAGGMRGMGGMM